jgi:YHS domain-containing protein
MDDFNLKKYLTENKLTSNSKILNENSSQTIEYRGKKYYIESPEGKEKVFAYTDPQLQQVAKVSGKSLMFKTKDVEDMLIKEGSQYDMQLANVNNVIYEVQDEEGFKLFRGTKPDCIEYIRENSKYRYYKDLT